ncbi:MAG: hypothetical protein C5B52_15825 [Bacteroidetes bacterium]|nr:MAG: hypothetical protein C5B52_15825 [Bacteroidota bacterium]
MKTYFYTLRRLSFHIFFLVIASCFGYVSVNAQATYSVPVAIGKPCSGSNSFADFSYNGSTKTLTQLPPLACTPTLGAPGFSISSSGVAFNPKDTNLYYTRYTGGNTYVWRWKPGSSCPPSTALLTTYPGIAILGLVFDPNGVGYQLIFTGSGPYGLSLQKVDFTTGTLGPAIPISLPGTMPITSQNGDLIITPQGQMLVIFDNKFFTVNYQDYGVLPLQATYINPIAGNFIVGLAYAEGKLLAADNANKYWEINILDGTKTAVTAPCYQSNDMSNINTGIGVAKKLSSVNPTATPGTYDVSYDIYVQNYGSWPLTGISLTDDLTLINGAGAISNVTATLVSNPAGVALNPTYDGVTSAATKNLIAANQNLNAYPVATNNFTVRVSFRISGIVPGTTYKNSATAKGTGYTNILVTDVSTNGSNPDLNSNGKPDDAGENQPTPLLISVAAELPPCAALNTVLLNQDFGSGSGLTTVIPGTGTTQYTGSTTNPIPTETYTISDNANNGNTTRWVNLTDHTGNAGGRMLLVNADNNANNLYRDVVNITCSNLKYSFFAYVANLGNSAYNTFCGAFGGYKNPKLIFTVRNAADNTIISNITTPDITSTSWGQYGFKFVMPAGVTQIILEITNAAPGGCGNDVALDDIQFGLCDPQPTVTAAANAGCIGGSTTLNGTLSDSTIISGGIAYQWQSSLDNIVWTDIIGATSANYTINPITAADAKYYRLRVQSASNTNPACIYTSNSFFLPLKSLSTPPTAITPSQLTTCPSNPVTLTRVGGSLGTNASWKWYSGSCGGTAVGTGNSISVNPAVTTTYFVRAEGDCNNTTCATVTITVVPCVILPVDFLQFSAVQHSDAVNLAWKIVTTDQIDHFEVERSEDGSNFTSIGSVKKNVQLNTPSSFEFLDKDLNVNSTVIYYRIKVVNKDGLYKYSNILVIRLTTLASDKIRIMPNPASSSVNISLYSALKGEVEIKLVDMTGKLVMRRIDKIDVGNNTITLNQLGQMSDGIYTVLIRINDRIEHERLVIKK